MTEKQNAAFKFLEEDPDLPVVVVTLLHKIVTNTLSKEDADFSFHYGTYQKYSLFSAIRGGNYEPAILPHLLVYLNEIAYRQFPELVEWLRELEGQNG